jgi:hypothetical protein
MNDDREQLLEMLEAMLRVERIKTREECAKEIDGLAFCEECHDCYDDLIRSAPYRRAAKYLRDNAMNEGGSK